jgi:hypothetical protein
MRRAWLVLWLTLIPTVAHAETTYSLGFGVRFIAMEASRAGGMGLTFGATVGTKRAKLLGEVDLGVLTSDGIPLGSYEGARLGLRTRIATFEQDPSFDLMLDSGVGVEHDSLTEAPSITRGYGFLGWLMQIQKSCSMAMRVEVSPMVDNEAVVRAVCRGTCTSSADAPFDLTIALFGSFVW